jgi:hypothetical protein
MELKRITSLALFSIVSLTVAMFTLFYYGKTTALNGVEITAKGVGIISAVSIILKWILSRELKEIDNKWHNFYEPMITKIEEFRKTIPSNANLKDYTNELYNLEKTLINIEENSDYDLPFMIKELRRHSQANLDRLLEAFNIEIKALKNDKRKWTKW